MKESSWYRAYLDVWDRSDVEGVLTFVADDVDFADVGAGHAFRGKEKMARFVRKSFQLVPDANFDLVDGAELGDSYWYEWIMQPMGVRGVSVGRTRDGKMVSTTGITGMRPHSRFRGLQTRPKPLGLAAGRGATLLVVRILELIHSIPSEESSHRGGSAPGAGCRGAVAGRRIVLTVLRGGTGAAALPRAVIRSFSGCDM